MSDFTRATLRAFGSLGATLVVLSTFITWYTFDVVFRVGSTVHEFAVGVDLWGPYTLAGILLVVGGAVGLVLVNMPPAASSRPAGIVAAAIAVAVVVYAVIRCLQIPDLGISQIASALAGGASAGTHLDGGPFLAIAGGLMLFAGAASLLVPSTGEATARVRSHRPVAT
jgi:hypothetical protein